MICDKCNQEVNEKEKYCNNCGEELTNKVPSFSSEEMLKASVFSSTIDKILVNKNSNILEKKKKKKRKKRLSLAIFMIVLGLSLMIAGLFMNKNEL